MQVRRSLQRKTGLVACGGRGAGLCPAPPPPKCVGLSPGWLVGITQPQGHEVDPPALTLAFHYPP